MEGGDFIPLYNMVFIGTGLRTNQSAINQLLNINAFDDKLVIVVKDPWLQQEQMHLDTYFNVISNKVVVLAEQRIKNTDMIPIADVYEM